jgi:hypothetical protein
MVDVATLRVVASDRSTRSLEVLAARLVLAAICGDMRAANMIANLIDGPVRRRLDDPPRRQFTERRARARDRGE